MAAAAGFAGTGTTAGLFSRYRKIEYAVNLVNKCVSFLLCGHILVHIGFGDILCIGVSDFVLVFFEFFFVLLFTFLHFLHNIHFLKIELLNKLLKFGIVVVFSLRRLKRNEFIVGNDRFSEYSCKIS